MTIEAGELADIGMGVKLTWDGSGSDKDYAILDWDGPGESCDAVEKTNSQSAGDYREFIAGLADAGELSVNLNFDPDKPIRVKKTGTVTLTFPLPAGKTNPATFECAAICTASKPAGKIDDVMACAVTFKLTGVPTYTASS